MAKKKNKLRKPLPPTKKVPASQHPVKSVKKKKKKPAVNAANKDSFGIKDYAVINLIFWAFCIALYFVVWLLTGENTGLTFLFGVLAIGFTLMSIFDGLYDHFTKGKKVGAQ